MKKILIKSFTWGAISVLIGGILFIIGFAFSGFSFDTLSGKSVTEKIYTETESERFDELEIDYKSTNVKIIFDPLATAITVSCPEILDKSGSKLSESIMINEGGKIKIKENVKWTNNLFTFDFTNPLLTVRIPADRKISLKLHCNNGSLSTEGNGGFASLIFDFYNGAISTQESILTIDTLFRISAKNGSITLGKVDTGHAELTSNNGKISVGDFSSRERVSISVDNGSIALNNRLAATEIDLETDNGSIKTYNAGILSAASIKAEADNGSIKIKLEGKSEDYGISVESGNGSSNVSNQGGGSKSLMLDVDNGDVVISFSE